MCTTGSTVVKCREKVNRMKSVHRCPIYIAGMALPLGRVYNSYIQFNRIRGVVSFIMNDSSGLHLFPQTKLEEDLGSDKYRLQPDGRLRCGISESEYKTFSQPTFWKGQPITSIKTHQSTLCPSDIGQRLLHRLQQRTSFPSIRESSTIKNFKGSK